MLLNVLLTHQGPEAVQANLRYLRALCPDSALVVCHGGAREDFDRISEPRKLFVEDESLRGPPTRLQSYNQLLQKVHAGYVAAQPAIDAVFVFEYDQVVLRPDFETALAQLLEHSGADFLGKNTTPRNDTNWIHALRFKRDPRFLAFLERLSVRDDPHRLYSCLGSGFVMRRPVLERFVDVEHFVSCYVELYLPTVVHHLGFAVEDCDRVSDIYDHVVHGPPKSLAEVLEAKRQGHFFAHPFKRVDLLGQVARAPGAGQSSASRSP